MGALSLAPGVPVPNADFLYRMIMTNVFKSTSSVDGSYIVDFLLGEPKKRDPDIPHINVLDYPTLRKVIRIAKLRHFNETLKVLDKKFSKKRKRLSDKLSRRRMFRDVATGNKTRRKWSISDDNWWVDYRQKRGNTYTWGPEDENLLRQSQAYQYARKFMSLMQQSVYQTQYNLKKTKFYRKKYQNDLNYRFALLYGMVLESKDKLDSLINVMLSLKYHRYFTRMPHAFIYFLSIYEKVLAATTDINYLAHHLMELTNAIREGVKLAQKKAEPRDKKKRPEVRRRRINLSRVKKSNGI